jgi:outer membrane protein assembly factor BamB
VGQVRNSSSVVANGVVVRAIRSDVFTGLQGIDAETGQQLWQQELTWNAELATDGNLVYVPLTLGEGIVAIDPHSGETVWTSVLVGSIGAPAIRDGVLYVWSSGEMVFALDAHSGDKLWQAYMAPSSTSTFRWDSYSYRQPAVGNDVVVSMSSSGMLNAFDRATGEEVWSRDGFNAANTRYVAAGDTLIVLNGSPSTATPTTDAAPFVLEGIDLATGETKWSANVRANLFQRLVVVTNPKTGEATVSLIAQEVQTGDQAATPVAIPASNTGIVFTLDAATGEIVTQSHGTNFAAIASTDDGTGLLLWPLYSRSTNQPIDLGQSIDGVPVKAGETIYVTLTDGTLVAIDRTKFAAG